MKLWLVRHARCPGGEGVCYGALDLPADAAATAAAAQALARELRGPLIVHASPLRRCMQLADALAALRPDLRAQRDARLREMDFGAWEGRPWAEIAPAELAAWTEDFPHYRCGASGECVAGFMRRVGAALVQVQATGRDTLWVTHAGVERAVRLLVQGAGVPAAANDWPRTGLAHGGFTRIPLATGPQETSSSGKS